MLRGNFFIFCTCSHKFGHKLLKNILKYFFNFIYWKLNKKIGPWWLDGYFAHNNKGAIWKSSQTFLKLIFFGHLDKFIKITITLFPNYGLLNYFLVLECKWCCLVPMLSFWSKNTYFVIKATPKLNQKKMVTFSG